jgi:hypothetical protein
MLNIGLRGIIVDIIKIYGVPSPKDQSSRMGGAYAKL